MQNSSECLTDAGSVTDRLASLRACVDALAVIDPTELGGELRTVVFHELHGVADRLEAMATQVLPAIETDGLWALDGARSFPAWLASRERMSVGAARRRVRCGRELRDALPMAAAAATAGQVSWEQAEVLARVATTSEARRVALGDPASACNEAYLVAQASLMNVEQLTRLTRRWAAAADPEADERGFREAVEREFVQLSSTMGGFHLTGFLTEEHGTGLALALKAVAGVPAVDDARALGQRRAQALADLSRAVLDRGLTGAGSAVRPHLSVHVSWEALRGLAGAGGELEGGAQIPASLLSRLACDSTVSRIVFGPTGQVLDVGRAQRTVTGQLRRAVVARDRHCQYPGCDGPPSLGEIHHARHWTDGGATSVTNGVLLCWHHHDWVHRQAVTIAWHHGRWRFHRRDGTAVLTDRACGIAHPCASAREVAASPGDAPPGDAPPGEAPLGEAPP